MVTSIEITKLTSQAMWWGVDCQEGWSWTKTMYGNHWEIDKIKFFSVKVSHKFINNYIFRVHNSFLLILSTHLSLDVGTFNFLILNKIS